MSQRNVPGPTGRHFPSRQKIQSAARQKPLIGPAGRVVAAPPHGSILMFGVVNESDGQREASVVVVVGKSCQVE